MKQAFIDQICTILNKQYVLINDVDKAPYLTDWRKKFTGKALAVVLPNSSDEVASIVRLCADNQVAVVPQGGHTGFCGGATPDNSGKQVVLNLKRMNRILEIDASNQTISLEAGCILQSVQEQAAAQGFLFPLNLGAKGSCMIGGNLATNAGGTNVLRYGNTRDLVLGLEVVLPSGEVLDMLRGLRKDNTGYDLKHLFIGSEGTLGLITAATLKLMPLPSANAVGMVAVSSPAKAVELLQHMRDAMGERFSAFELMSSAIVELTRRYFPALPQPFADPHDWYVLMEVADGGTDAALAADFQAALEQALERELVLDVVITQSQAQAQAQVKNIPVVDPAAPAAE